MITGEGQSPTDDPFGPEYWAKVSQGADRQTEPTTVDVHGTASGEFDLRARAWETRQREGQVDPQQDLAPLFRAPGSGVDTQGLEQDERLGAIHPQPVLQHTDRYVKFCEGCPLLCSKLPIARAAPLNMTQDDSGEVVVQVGFRSPSGKSVVKEPVRVVCHSDDGGYGSDEYAQATAAAEDVVRGCDGPVRVSRLWGLLGHKVVCGAFGMTKGKPRMEIDTEWTDTEDQYLPVRGFAG